MQEDHHKSEFLVILGHVARPSLKHNYKDPPPHRNSSFYKD